jgi:hypothetical protein
VKPALRISSASNFQKLWEEGMGRLAAVYLLSLFGFVIWVGLAISLGRISALSLPWCTAAFVRNGVVMCGPKPAKGRP